MKNQIATSTLLAYSGPALPLAIPTVVIYVLLPAYYVEHYALPLLWTGVLLMLARLTDVITDPLIGHWLDRGNTRTYRLSLILGGLICIPSLLLLINPPTEHAMLTLFCGSLLLYLGWTLIQVPYITWLSHLSTDSYQRARAATGREGLALIGLLLSASLPVVAVSLGFDTQATLWLMAAVTILLGAPLIAGLLRFAMPLQTQTHQPGLGKKHSSGRHWALLQNRLALRLVAAWFCNGIANGVPAVLFPFYITAVLGGTEADRPVYILIYFAAACLSLPLWLILSKKIDKRVLWQLAMSGAVLAFLPAPWLGPGDEVLFMLICILTGAALGADLALPHAMQAEITDWDRFRFRRQQTGLLFALWNGATKLALALAALLALGLLELSGYSAENAAPLLALGLIYALLPCVFKAGAIALLWGFPLKTHHHTAIQRRLMERSGRSSTHASYTDIPNDISDTDRLQQHESRTI
ncbi:MFS transporter [Nitrincola sp. MINF-07-Sa-05]|uniref:MFS transporter n=1 Tax=Nitrincola salilacus TaxID=3400273 RepID=UPI0039182D6B